MTQIQQIFYVTVPMKICSRSKLVDHKLVDHELVDHELVDHKLVDHKLVLHITDDGRVFHLLTFIYLKIECSNI